MQHEPLLRVERRAQRPAVPADLATLDGEADALGLRDLDRPQVVARGDGAGGVGAVRAGDRLDVELLELEHAALVDVHVRDQALDRMRVAVVARVRAQVGDSARDAPAALDLEPEAARGEHVDLHERDVVDAAPPQRLAPAGIGAHRLGGGLVVLGRDRRPRAGRRVLRDDRAGSDVAHELLHAVLAIDDDRERAARGSRAAVEPGQVLGLGRLLKADRDEARVLDARPREGGCPLELAGRERLERVCRCLLDHHATTIARARPSAGRASDRPAGAQLRVVAKELLVEIVELARTHDRRPRADALVVGAHVLAAELVAARDVGLPAGQHVEVEVGHREHLAKAPRPVRELALEVGAVRVHGGAAVRADLGERGILGIRSRPSA